MKFVPDCARDIMLAVEALEPNKTLTIPRLAEMYPDYSEDVLNYHCLKLLEADFIDASQVPVRGQVLPQISKILALTYDGHQALEDIRPQSVWERAKKSAAKVGSLSMHALAEAAAAIVSSKITGLSQ